MLTQTAASVKTLRRLDAKLEEAQDSYSTAYTQLRRAERMGRWEDAREWRIELAGVEKDIAAIQSQIDDLLDDGTEQGDYIPGYGEAHF